MRVYFNGQLMFSRALSQEEIKDVLGFIGMTEKSLSNKSTEDKLVLGAAGMVRAIYDDTELTHLIEMVRWCSHHNVSLLEDSYLQYHWEAGIRETIYAGGKWRQCHLAGYTVKTAPTKDLIEELKDRGIWQKQERLIEIGAEYIRKDLLDPAIDSNEVLRKVKATDEELEAMGLDDILTGF